MDSDGYGKPVRRFFEKGRVIFTEGDKGDAAYLLESGTVSIRRKIGDTQVELGLVREWGIFGEFALLDEAPRSASAVALEDCSCVLLHRDTVEDLIEQMPPTMAAIIRAVVRTARTASGAMAEMRAELDALKSRTH